MSIGDLYTILEKKNHLPPLLFIGGFFLNNRVADDQFSKRNWRVIPVHTITAAGRCTCGNEQYSNTKSTSG